MPEALQDAFGLTGSVLEGHYRVDRVVGEGGFGVVYRGHHLSLDQPIAIKVLKGLDGGDPHINGLVLEKFRAEARLLYRLSQSSLNIVRALDFNATTTPSGAWAPYMILEWLDGRSLADDLEDRARRGAGGRMIQEALAILAPVAEGLAVAHREQVAHRDVKPANVFLLQGGPDSQARLSRPNEHVGPHVKVLDFGIAKIMKEGEAAGTRGTFASFTWLYAAPEQLDPRFGTTGLTTDVYAFGLMITELLTGRAPVDERDVVSIMHAATNAARRPTPRTRGANVTDEVEAICARALAVDPRARFPSIVELWTAFAAAARTKSTTAMQRVVVAPGGAHPLAQTNVAPPSGLRPSMPSSSGLPPPRPSLPSAAQWTPPPPTPPGYAPPQQLAPTMAAAQWGPSPPPGTAPPGMQVRRFPIRAPDGMSHTAVLGIVFFVLALFLAGSCAMVHACLNVGE